MGKLDGKVAVITGGSSGIGLASARRLVQDGAYVFITGRRQKELDEARASIGQNVTAVQGDASDLADLDRLYATVRSERNAIDIVVTSAGFVELAPLAAITPEHFDRTFDLNARGTLFTVQKALPLLRDGGSVVMVSSSAHLKGVPVYTTYAASKAAIRSFARSWAQELSPRRIRVNTVSPGGVETPLIDGQFPDRNASDGMRAMLREITPLGRLGRAEEIAAIVAFLASDESSYVTGTDLVADGGMTQV